MAITYVGAGSGAGSSGSITPTLPSGWAVDDIFLLLVETLGGQTPSAPSGWTQAGNTEGDDTQGTLFWRRAESGDSNPTVSDSGNHTIGLITAWRGCKTTGNPWEAIQASSNASFNTSVSATGVTTLGTDRMIVMCTTAGDDSTYSSWACSSLESVTEAAEYNSTAGQDGAVAFAYGIKATAGATGSFTATISTSEDEANFVLALEPAATSSEDDLLADDVESSSEVTSPAIGQEHDLAATSVSSNSEVTSPGVGQEHSLAADDVQATTEVTTPSLSESHALLADDLETTSEVTSPSVGQVHGLFAVDVQAAAEVSLPALGEPLTVTVSQRHTISLTEIRQTSSPVDLRASTSKPVTRKTQSAVIRRHSVSPADDNRSVS